jgi:hypothetical protein
MAATIDSNAFGRLSRGPSDCRTLHKKRWMKDDEMKNLADGVLAAAERVIQ